MRVQPGASQPQLRMQLQAVTGMSDEEVCGMRITFTGFNAPHSGELRAAFPSCMRAVIKHRKRCIQHDTVTLGSVHARCTDGGDVRKPSDALACRIACRRPAHDPAGDQRFQGCHAVVGALMSLCVYLS